MPTVSVSLFMESLFASGCAFPRKTTRSEREGEREKEGAKRSAAAAHAWRIKNPSPPPVDVADGSAEGRPLASTSPHSWV